MQRFLKVAVTETVYWGVQAIAAESKQTQGAVTGALLAEALMARAHDGGGPTIAPSDDFGEQIAQIAGVEGISTEHAHARLLSMGIEVWRDDAMTRGDFDVSSAT